MLFIIFVTLGLLFLILIVSSMMGVFKFSLIIPEEKVIENNEIFTQYIEGYVLRDEMDVLQKNQLLQKEDEKALTLYRLLPIESDTQIKIVDKSGKVIAADYFNKDKFNSKKQRHLIVRLAEEQYVKANKDIQFRMYEEQKEEPIVEETVEDEEIEIKKNDTLAIKEDLSEIERVYNATLSDIRIVQRDLEQQMDEVQRQLRKVEDEEWIVATSKALEGLEKNGKALAAIQQPSEHDIIRSIVLDMKRLGERAQHAKVEAETSIGVIQQALERKEKPIRYYADFEKEPFLKLDRILQEMSIYQEAVQSKISRIDFMRIEKDTEESTEIEEAQEHSDS